MEIRSFIHCRSPRVRRSAILPDSPSCASWSSTICQISTMPDFWIAEQVRTRGVHPSPDGGNKCSADAYSTRARSAFCRLSPSALLIAIPSIISMMPRLMPCSSSPAPASINNKKKSDIERTAVSDCPTPTVSINTLRKPAASHNRIVSRVRRATPPRCPPDGEGRMNACGSADKCSIRVLSPRMLPPEIGLDGSTVRTARRSPRSWITCIPSASMKVLLPTPGTPVMPTRRDFPVCGRIESSNRAARSASAGRRLSISVMARARTTRSPARTPSTYCSSDSRRPPARAAGEELGTNIARQCVQDDLCANWDHGAWTEYASHARLLQIIIILRRDYSACIDQNVPTAAAL